MAGSFSEQKFKHAFVDQFPGDPENQNFTRAVQNILYSEVNPTPVSNPKLIAWSHVLSDSLGISKPDPMDAESLNLLSGNSNYLGLKPYASRYGGHQFGNWAGQLGDGRAITLGEIETASGKMEFQLKGAGPTPYSRRGDGRAVLRSSLREFLCSEAMHFLGVPTTRALSLVLTGDSVVRDFFYDGNPKAEPGAIVCRVSPSFIRFGHFEILARQNEIALLKKLADFVTKEFYPGLSYEALLKEVAKRTAILTVHWMRVGFVHGVMNTDNMSILGLTIDYGPYGWLEPYEPNFTPNTTDAEMRRYSFLNQPGISLWNITRLAEAFSPLISDRIILEECVQVYQDTFESEYLKMLSDKLGLNEALLGDGEWIHELFRLLEGSQADYTLFFRALSNWELPSDFYSQISGSFYLKNVDEAKVQAWSRWGLTYQELIKKHLAEMSHSPGGEKFEQVTEKNAERLAKMKRVNPKYVLRNYIAQNAIRAAEAGDYSLLNQVLLVLEKPYDEQIESEAFAALRPDWAKNSPGSSTLSCSS